MKNLYFVFAFVFIFLQAGFAAENPSLIFPVKDFQVMPGGSLIDFKWKSSNEEPQIMWLKVKGKNYKIKIDQGVSSKKVKVRPNTQISWMVQGAKSKKKSKVATVKSIAANKAKLTDETKTKEVSIVQQTTEPVYAIDLIFKVSNTDIESTIQDGAQPADIDAQYPNIGFEIVFKRKEAPIMTGCFPGANFEYFATTDDGEIEGSNNTNFKNFSGYELSAYCLYAFPSFSFSIGPALGFVSKPVFKNDDQSFTGTEFATSVFGVNALFSKPINETFTIQSTFTTLTGSDFLEYELSADLILNYFELPILIGGEFSQTQVDGTDEEPTSQRLGLRLGTSYQF